MYDDKMKTNCNNNAYYSYKTQKGAYLVVNPVPELTFEKNKSFTISIQFNITNLEQNYCLLKQENIFEMAIEEKKVIFKCHIIGNISSDIIIQEGVWYTVCVSYEESQLKLWVNGIPSENANIIEGDLNPDTLSNPYIIGMKKESLEDTVSVAYFRYVKIFDYAMKQKQIQHAMFEDIIESDTIPLLLDFTNGKIEDLGKYKFPLQESNFNTSLTVSGNGVAIPPKQKELSKLFASDSFTILSRIKPVLTNSENSTTSYLFATSEKNKCFSGLVGLEIDIEKQENGEKSFLNFLIDKKLFASKVEVPYNAWSNIALCCERRIEKKEVKISIFVDENKKWEDIFTSNPILQTSEDRIISIGNRNDSRDVPFEGEIETLAILSTIPSDDKIKFLMKDLLNKKLLDAVVQCDFTKNEAIELISKEPIILNDEAKLIANNDTDLLRLCKGTILSNAFSPQNNTSVYMNSEAFGSMAQNTFTILSKIFLNSVEKPSTVYSCNGLTLSIQRAHDSEAAVLCVKSKFDDSFQNGNITLPLNQWLDIALLYNGNKKEISLYVDGEFHESFGSQEFSASHLDNFYVGNTSEKDSAFSGYISYIGLFKSELEQKQLKDYLEEPPFIFDSNLDALMSFSYPTIWNSYKQQQMMGDPITTVLLEDKQDKICKNRNFVQSYKYTNFQKWQACLLATIYGSAIKKLFGLEPDGYIDEDNFIIPNDTAIHYLIKKILPMHSAWRIISSYQNPVGILDFIKELDSSNSIPILHKFIFGNGKDSKYQWIASCLSYLLNDSSLEKEIANWITKAIVNSPLPEQTPSEFEGFYCDLQSIIFNHSNESQKTEQSSIPLCTNQGISIPEWQKGVNSKSNPSNALYIKKSGNLKPYIIAEFLIDNEYQIETDIKIIAEYCNEQGVLGNFDSVISINESEKYQVELSLSNNKILEQTDIKSFNEINWSYEYAGNLFFIGTTFHNIYTLDSKPCEPWKIEPGYEEQYVTVDDLEICDFIQKNSSLSVNSPFVAKITDAINHNSYFVGREYGNHFASILSSGEIHYNRAEARTILKKALAINNNFSESISPLDVSLIIADYCRLLGNDEIGVLKLETNVVEGKIKTENINGNEYAISKNDSEREVPLHINEFHILNTCVINTENVYLTNHWCAATIKHLKDMVIYDGYYGYYNTSSGLKFTTDSVNPYTNFVGKSISNGYRETLCCRGSLCVPTRLHSTWKIASSLPKILSEEKTDQQEQWNIDYYNTFLSKQNKLMFTPISSSISKNKTLCNTIQYCAIEKTVQNIILKYIQSEISDDSDKTFDDSLQSVTLSIAAAINENSIDLGYLETVKVNINMLKEAIHSQKNKHELLVTTYYGLLEILKNFVANQKEGDKEWSDRIYGNLDPSQWYHIDQNQYVTSSYQQISYADKTLYSAINDFNELPKINTNSFGFYLTNLNDGIKIKKWLDLNPEIREPLSAGQIKVLSENKNHYCLESSANNYSYPYELGVFKIHEPIHYVYENQWKQL